MPIFWRDFADNLEATIQTIEHYLIRVREMIAQPFSEINVDSMDEDEINVDSTDDESDFNDMFMSPGHQLSGGSGHHRHHSGQGGQGVLPDELVGSDGSVVGGGMNAPTNKKGHLVKPPYSYIGKWESDYDIHGLKLI